MSAKTIGFELLESDDGGVTWERLSVCRTIDVLNEQLVRLRELKHNRKTHFKIMEIEELRTERVYSLP